MPHLFPRKDVAETHTVHETRPISSSKMGNSFLEPVSASGLSNTPLTRATEPDARRLLSDKAFNAIQDRSFEKTIDILQDVYDKETNPEGWVNLGVAENVERILINSCSSPVSQKRRH